MDALSKAPEASTTLESAMPDYLASRQAAIRRERLLLVLMALLGVGGFVSARFLVGPIERLRIKHQLVMDAENAGTIPPDIELMSKLGPLRALAIDWAFIRYEKLKEEGKNYEALELAELLCRLQPRFDSIWAYNAWNMAYNISVAEYTREGRWKWVSNGISLLRDQGLKYNPKSITLYKELAYIYWHKISDFLDDEHMNYKRAVAVDMERILGPPRFSLTPEEAIEAFRPIAEAPTDFQKFLADDIQAKQLADALSGLGFPPDTRLLELVARYVRPEIRLETLLKSPEKLAPETAQALAILNDAEQKPALDRLLAALRAKVLREKLKMQPDWMAGLMKEFGPIDWRAAWAHSLYWATYGDHVVQGFVNINPSDEMNTVRFIFFSLQHGMTRGRMVLVPNFDSPFDSYIDFMEDNRFIPYLFDAYLKYGKQQYGDREDFVEGTPGKQYMVGFVNFLHYAIGNLYREGGEKNLALAQQYYTYLRKYNREYDGDVQERYLVPLDEFVYNNLKEELVTFRQSNAIVRGFLSRSFTELAVGNDLSAATALSLARWCYDYFMEDSKADRDDRRKMQFFEVMRRDELLAYVSAPDIPIEYKVWLWARLEKKGVRQHVWELAKPVFAQICAEHDPPLDPGKAFPEPPDMDTYDPSKLELRHELRTDFDPGTKEKQ